MLEIDNAEAKNFTKQIHKTILLFKYKRAFTPKILKNC